MAKAKSSKKSSEARIYSFGAKVPITNEDLVRNQLVLVHRYRNRLVELELERRRKTDEALRALSPCLDEVESKILAGEAMLEELNQRLKQARVSARGRPKALPEDVVCKRGIMGSLLSLRGERRELRKELFASDGWATSQASINDWENAEQKSSRKEAVDKGLWWGSYLPVEQAAKAFRKGAPPRFRGWRGNSKIAVQLQGGLPVDKFREASDTRLRLVAHPDGIWTGDGRVCTDGEFRRRKLGNAMVWIRVGSTELKKPIWAQVPIMWHREIPPGSTIKWAYLHRRMRGTKEVWEFQLIIVAEPGTFDRTDQAKRGVVGIDVGWRKFPDRLRVAVWAGSDGAEGELALPAWWVAESQRVERIRGHRDQALDAAKAVAKTDIKALGERAPDWLAQAGKAMHAWRSSARLASLCLRWRRERLDEGLCSHAECESLDRLEVWRHRDKHLLEYESHLRAQLQGSRKDLYRRFAARLSYRYAKAAMEGRLGKHMDLGVFHRLAPLEEEGSAANDAKTAYVRDACLSMLFGALEERMRESSFFDPANTTKKCHACGKVDVAWTDHAAVDHTCPHCGVTWDQDVNAARNLLGASGTVVQWTREPLAPADVMSYGQSANKAMRRRMALPTRPDALVTRRISNQEAMV